MLAPGLVQDHRSGIGQVQAPAVGQHGNANDMGCIEGVEDLRGQAAGLGPEQKQVLGPVIDLTITGRAPGGDGEHPRRLQPLQQAVIGFIFIDSGELVVIESRPFQLPVIHLKSQRPNEMQARAGIGAQAYNVPGVWWNLRFEQRDVKH